MKVKMENVARGRRRWLARNHPELGIGPADFERHERKIARLRPGDHVTIPFRTAGVEVPGALEEFREAGYLYPVGENMWVEITRIEGAYPNAVYHGELANRPVFIDPAELRLGSPLSFTKDFIHTIYLLDPEEA